MRGETMKKIAFLLTFLLVVGVAFAVSQPVEGKKFEFSTGLSFAAYAYHPGDEPAGYSSKETYFNVPVRIGWFFWKGLEFEPEFMLTSYHDSYNDGAGYTYDYKSTGYILSGNLLYNFKLTNSRFVPFLLAGYGIGNAVPYENYAEKWESGTKTSTPNIGAGVKYLFGNTAALRLEYRYRNFRITYSGEDDGGTEHIIINSVILGICLFF
jgi:opacity protein-like surface antigen